MLIGGFGHMSKEAGGAEAIAVDLVIEVLDARLPVSSSNPCWKSCGGKTVHQALNKRDPPIRRYRNGAFLNGRTGSGVATGCKNHAEAGQLAKLCQRPRCRTGETGAFLRVMVVGIPTSANPP
jgi:ribosome biogenesis GTPase A